MAQPPRLETIYLRWDQEVIYFVTICTRHRRKCLADPQVFKAIKTTIEGIHRWQLIAGVIMPDHIHALVSPVEDREIPVGDFSTAFKRLLRKEMPHTWEWQRGCFDRLLRKEDHAYGKWLYMRDNPVRQGLVHEWSEWPYYINLADDYKQDAHSAQDAL